jgi:hypothetical protein
VRKTFPHLFRVFLPPPCILSLFCAKINPFFTAAAFLFPLQGEKNYAKMCARGAGKVFLSSAAGSFQSFL